MPLRLSIENMPSLPDGGPVSIAISGKRGLDVGRDQYLDWVLPDPSRVVSGKHCEIRYQDGGYWLRDTSTNGTFVNQNPRRLTDPHRLQNGDRIEIGHYIIRVDLDGEEAGSGQGAVSEGAGGGLWDAADAAPAVDPDSLKAPAKPSLLAADPLDHWLANAPIGPATPPPPPAFAPPPAFTPPPAAVPVDDIWSIGPEGDPAMPSPAMTPRRLILAPGDPAGGFAAPAIAAVPGQPPVPPPTPVVASPSPPPPPAAVPIAPPTPVAPPVAAVPPQPPSAAAGEEFIRRFAEGAGLEPEAIAMRDAGDLAHVLGMLIQICAGNVGQLLLARAQAKSAMRSASQTMIQLQGNNPLRWAPTPQDAMKLMFGRPTPSYVDACNAFEKSFQTLKNHEMDTFAALQEAIQILFGDLDPAVIERALGGDGKKGGFFGNDKALKARMWDEFAARWTRKTGAFDSGMFGAFMRVFGEAYDRKVE
jgi:type VI secretion system protein ImpI